MVRRPCFCHGKQSSSFLEKFIKLLPVFGKETEKIYEITMPCAISSLNFLTTRSFLTILVMNVMPLEGTPMLYL
jgi:hypothetical protein